MEQKQIDELKFRNKKIIDLVLQQIKINCPDSIELIGIGGSFCNGDIYEKSDLDLVLICSDDKASCLNKCFILDDVAFDVYTHDWSSFESYALYTHPYVTKLLDLDIIYATEDALIHYKKLQGQVKENMQNNEFINKNIRIHFNNALTELHKLEQSSNISEAFMIYSKIIKSIEYTIYMLNKSYVKRGTKRVPEEILNMSILPEDFEEIYSDITNCSSIDEMKIKANLLINSVKLILDESLIDNSVSNEEKNMAKKTNISAEDLRGTYEEIYSNWKNKMIHASKINSRYLSFVTMVACQEFYDEMFNQFDIPHIDLIGKYNPNNLAQNVESFNWAMAEWKKLYDQFNVNINYYANLDELEDLYGNKNLVCETKQIK